MHIHTQTRISLIRNTTHANVHKYEYTHIQAYIHTNLRTLAQKIYIHTQTCTNTDTQTHTYSHTHMHTHNAYTHKDTYNIYTFIHTYIYSQQAQYSEIRINNKPICTNARTHSRTHERTHIFKDGGRQN